MKNILLMIVFGMIFIGFTSATWCYQESANVSTACGGFNTGTYSCSGTWDTIDNCSKLSDGNWSSYGYELAGVGNFGAISINYTKTNSTNESLWQVKIAESFLNITIPSSCWDFSDKLQLKITTGSSPNSLRNLSCYDGSWNVLFNHSNGFTSVEVFEEAMWWDIGSNPPTILVTGGNGTLTYQNFSTNHTLNYTITDTHLDDCWLNYNSTNRTIPCTSGIINTTNFTLQLGLYNATIWANDTFGNTQSRFVNWSYRLLFMNQSYTTSVLEGVSSTFTANAYTNGTDLTIAWFNYNGINYYGTLTENSDDFFTLSLARIAPVVSADTNYTFYWAVTQGVFGNQSFPSNNQTVKNIGIDNCTTNANVLYNFTLKDEELQTKINGTGSNSYAELNLQMYGYGSSTLIQSFYKVYNQTNPFAVCLNNTFGSEQYNLDLQVKYQATGYETEYYHIQNATIGNSTFTTNITLYDLNTTDSQVFKLSIKDTYYLPVANAIIQIFRKYIGENEFKIVEIPKTDNYGETTGHLSLNDVIYSFLIVKNNVVLATFNNTIPVCQTPLVSPCTIEFTYPVEGSSVPDFFSERDFNFTLGYNQTSRVVSSYFEIPSGTPSTIQLVVTTEDVASTSVCTDTITSSSGTLTCTVPSTIGNTTVRATLYKNGVFQSYGNIRIDDNFAAIYSGVVILLSLIAFLTLAGLGLSNSPILTAFFLMVGLIFIFALNLVPNKGFLGATATILFILIAILVLIIKGVRRN